MKHIINDFINSIDTKLYNRIRTSKGDAECRRYLKEHLQKQLTIPRVVLQSEQLCDNPHCEDGIVDRDMYGHPIYCQVCDSHN